MNIWISGGTGLLGSALAESCLALGHTVTIVSRSREKVTKIFGDRVGVCTWEDLSTTSMSGCEVCIHLSGTSIMRLPRSRKNKERIWKSRTDSTKRIVSCLPDSCHSFLCASAIGFYTPSSGKRGFLQELCAAWEFEATKAQNPTRRVMHLRTGLVTGPGTFEDTLKRSMKFFGGVVLGSGNQFMPQIRKDERVSLVVSAIQDNKAAGPLNLVTRNITYRAYIQQLAKELRRPVRLTLPARCLHMLMGEAATLFVDSWEIEPISL